MEEEEEEEMEMVSLKQWGGWYSGEPELPCAYSEEWNMLERIRYTDTQVQPRYVTLSDQAVNIKTNREVNTKL